MFQQRSELVFDRWDEEEGIFDPTPASQVYPECDKDGYSSIIFRQRPNKNGYFNYKLSPSQVSVLSSNIKDLNEIQQLLLQSATTTFWSVIMKKFD